MKRVVLSGPESTGKTTLAQQLSECFECPLVEEYARTYIDQLGRTYSQNDLLYISEGQIDNELIVSKSSDLLICDTDLLTIKVWSEFKYGNCDPWIVETLNNNLPDLYLICYPDLKWEYDPQRENPNDGLVLFVIYLSEIEKLGVPFQVIKGKDYQRFDNAVNAVRKIIF